MSRDMNYYRKKGSYQDRPSIKRIAPLYIALLIFIFTVSAWEISGLKIFNCAPALTFLSVCAIGFIFGEKSGAIFGIVGGVIIDALGFSGSAFSPVLFTLCAYLCGRMVGWFLSKNLPSFIIYGLIAAVINEIFTLMIIGVMSTEFEILYVIKEIIVPEFFSSVIFICPIYLILFGIYRLLCRKDKREFRF